MKRILTHLTALLTAGMFLTNLNVQAQETPDEYVPYPHVFFGLQGGGQLTLSNHGNFRYVTPTASAAVGVHFTPILGARIHANGIWNKSGIRIDGTDVKYKYKYVTTDLDLMINMVNLIAKGNYHPLNVYLIGGVGINYAWDNQEKPELSRYLLTRDTRNRLSHNFRVGAQLDYKVARNWSVNLELDANSLSDRFNSKTWSGSDDWQFTAQLGVTYRLGLKKHKKVVEPAPIPEPVYETRIDTTWYDDVQYKDVTADRDIKKEIFFGIRESGVSQDEAQIKAVAEFLKGVKNGEITITAYADKGTGTPALNMKYSKERAEKTRKALIDQGVDPNMIKKVEWKGDTVQPYAENDKNRVSVITGHGIYTDKEKVVTKKFNTKEVRYQVK